MKEQALKLFVCRSLSVMKVEARRRRKQRELQRSQVHTEKKRRMKALVEQYSEWSDGLVTGGTIDLALVGAGERKRVGAREVWGLGWVEGKRRGERDGCRGRRGGEEDGCWGMRGGERNGCRGS